MLRKQNEQFKIPLYFQYIQMPSREEADQISEEIYEKTGFPHVMGLIDGTHIEILKPSSKCRAKAMLK